MNKVNNFNNKKEEMTFEKYKASNKFRTKQLELIKAGLDEGLDVERYADPDNGVEKMREIMELCRFIKDRSSKIPKDIVDGYYRPSYVIANNLIKDEFLNKLFKILKIRIPEDKIDDEHWIREALLDNVTDLKAEDTSNHMKLTFDFCD